MPFFTRLFHKTTFLLLGLLTAVGALAAQDFDDYSISGIKVEGNTIIAAAEILSGLKVKPQYLLGEAKGLMNWDLQELWRTGKFKDVQMVFQPGDSRTGILSVIVSERPLIAGLAVKGNSALSEKELLEKSGLKTGDFFDEFTATRAAQKIANYYKEKEFYQAQVEFSAEPKDNAMVLEFKVTEGLKVKVTKIGVIGNQAFSEGKIKGFMETKEAGWFVGGTYKEETFKEDLKKLLVGYAREGYLKARVNDFALPEIDGHFAEIAAKALSVNEGKKEMTITLNISEGVQYRLGQLSVTGNIIFSQEEILRRMELKAGDILNRLTFEMGLQQIRLAYSEKGYIFADVTPDMTYFDDSGKVDVAITIRENTIARIEKIDIRGNTTTKDKVIRRELTVNTGEPFDNRVIQKSKEKIMNLGFFQDVKVFTEPGTTSGDQVLVFEVEERHTGTISLGAGYSSVDYLMGYLQLTQANLFGNGQSVSVQWELGSRRQSWNLSFTEPWLFDAPVSFGVDVWNNNKRKGYLNQGYNLLSQGGDIRLGRRFDDSWKGYLTYKLESNEYSDVDIDSATNKPLYPEGRSDVSSLTPALVYDTRDNIFDATTGVLGRASVEFAGGPLGGDSNYIKYMVDGSYYLPLIWQLVLAFHTEAGYVDYYDYGFSRFQSRAQEIPPDKLFKAGGTDSVRGYDDGIFGPGKAKLLGNVELHFPIIGPLKGVTFFDVGDITSEWKGLATAHFYKGTGLGFRLTIPGTVILIRFDFGYALDTFENKAPGWKFHFNIGNIF